VEHYLRLFWSPEQVSGYLKRTFQLSISHETIYQHIRAHKASGGDLYTHLRGAQKRRRKSYAAYDSRGRLAGKPHIDERPSAADVRSEFGHWEIDTVLGKGSKHCIVTVAERSTSFTIIGKLKARTKEELNARVVKLIQHHAGPFKTITAENRTEFHGYKDIGDATGATLSVARPYHSWERGLNENTNGVIRQYLPKSDSISPLTQRECYAIADKLDSRPRKKLSFKTPPEAFYERFNS